MINKMLSWLYRAPNFAFFTAIICGIGLGFMYVLQYFFGFAPCHLCHMQRFVVMALIATLLIGWSGFFIFGRRMKILDTCMAFAAIISCGSFSLATYQVAVEKALIDLPENCATPNIFINDVRLLDMAMQNNATIACNIPQFIGFFSVAEWSLIGTLLLFWWMLFYWLTRRM